MYRISILIFLFSLSFFAHAQQDSVVRKTDLPRSKLSSADSISNHFLQKADSFSLAKKQGGKLKQKSDSLRQKIVNGNFLKSRKHRSDTTTANKSSLDSSKQKVAKRFNNLKNRKPSALQNKTDSVRSKLALQQFTNRANAKADSIKNPKLLSDTSNVARKKQSVDSLKTAYAQRLDSIKSKVKDPLKIQHKTDSLTKAYNGALTNKLKAFNKKGVGLSGEEKDFLQKSGMPNLPAGSLPELNTALPDLKMPSSSGIKAPETNGMIPSLQGNAQLPDAPQTNGDLNTKLPKGNLPDLPTIPGKEKMEEIQSKVGDVKELSGKVGEYAADVKQVKEEGLAKTKNLDKVAEEGVKNIDEVQALQGELSGAEKLKQFQQIELEKINNAQSMRDQLSSKIVTEKILANEDKIKPYMEKMGKYKKKFDNVPDIRYVPKVKPNSMKDKPLKERLVLGSLFQILKVEDNISWYIAPELLYKISGTLSVGTAGMYALQYTTAPKFIWTNPIYGYKMIAQGKTYKGFYTRVEFENTSLVIPQAKKTDGERVWSNNFLVGLGRTQKISNRLNGYFWGFYNLTRDPRDVFRTKVIVKTGLQFNLVNNHKKVQKHITDKIEKRAEESRINVQKPDKQEVLQTSSLDRE